MKLKYYLHRAISIPPHKLALKVMDRTGRKIKYLFQQQNDVRSSTYSHPVLSSSGELHRYLQTLPINLLHSQVEKISMLAELFLAHQFNLLGSSWAQVKHGMSCRGLDGYRYEMGSLGKVDSEGHWLKSRINQSNLVESQRIWSLVDHNYKPIDWQLDFKSGFRWSENTWYLDIPFGHKPGVDIKVPWELARMQHLPHLVWAYALAGNGQPGFLPPQVYVKEFRSQLLDFMSTNPPRFGVNWRCSMDIAIRVANWLVTYDLFRAYGVNFDASFRNAFLHSVYQHGQHIVNNLEWNETLRGNHYLANIVGLLFVAAYLPRTPETDAWLAFAVQELVSEVECQFTSDGANFEASTSYHRLSSEMTIYGTAIILGLPEEKQAALRNYDCQLLTIIPKLKRPPAPSCVLARSDRLIPFPPWYIERLERMAEFTKHITKPNGRVIQIGDNDSGRFLKLHPVFHRLTVTEAKAYRGNKHGYADLPNNATCWDENHLDHRHLVAAINGLFQRDDFTRFTGEGWVETHIIHSLAKGICLPSYKQREESIRTKRVSIEIVSDEEEREKLDLRNEPKRAVIKPHGNEQYRRHRFYAYPDFGLYIYRSEHFYLAIRYGTIGQNGNGGHAHNDQLSFELSIKDHDFLVDGGSFLYTPLPEIRNEFRSTRAHNTISICGFEQNRWEEGFNGLFSMKNDVQNRILNYNDEYFEGEYFSNGIKHGRSFKLGRGNIIIEDTIGEDSFGELNLNLAPGVEIIQISKNGLEEFTLPIKINDIYPRIILNGFSGVDIMEGFFSKGYGERLRNQLVKCHRSRDVTKVIIEIGMR